MQFHFEIHESVIKTPPRVINVPRLVPNGKIQLDIDENVYASQWVAEEDVK